jgi:hypothetical protein
VYNEKVGHSLFGEIEWHQRMPIGIFSLCAIRLLKLTPDLYSVITHKCFLHKIQLRANEPYFEKANPNLEEFAL